MPGQWSTLAPQVDWLFYFIYWMSVVLFVGIIGAALYFVWKYQRKPGVAAEPTGHNLPLEVGWTVAPMFFLALLFHWGFQGYVNLTVAPANAMEIRVRGKKWSWDFEYPNGGHTTNDLHVPVNRPVKLIISSDDVLHAMFIPAFRVKRDAVPGMYGTLWFQATHEGETPLFCAEYCGAAESGSRDAQGREVWAGHYAMTGTVTIESDERFATFMRGIIGPPMIDGRPATPVEWGQRLYRSQQCYTCHTVDGSTGTGPTWRGIAGHQVQLADGTSVLADDQYLRQSILEPNSQVVRGFNPVMPTYRGSLTEEQIRALIAYIQSLQ
jgi:cytochrome c oxidase subunit 2